VPAVGAAAVLDWLTSNSSEVPPYTANRIRQSFPRVADTVGAFGDLAREAAVDVGSGAGYDSFALATQFQRVVAVDSDASALRDARRVSVGARVTNIEWIAADATEGRGDQSYDFAWCNIMSHGTRSRIALLEAIRRCLRDGGGLFYAEECEGYPALELEGALADRDYARVVERVRQGLNGLMGNPGFRFFRSGTFAQLAEALGFAIEEHTTSDWNGLPYVEVFRARVASPHDGHAISVSADRDYLVLPGDLAALRADRAAPGPLRVYLDLADSLKISASPGPFERGPSWVRRRLRRPDWARLDEIFAAFVEQLSV
jgi:SAM-dependent methyltransferase